MMTPSQLINKKSKPSFKRILSFLKLWLLRVFTIIVKHNSYKLCNCKLRLGWIKTNFEVYIVDMFATITQNHNFYLDKEH